MENQELPWTLVDGILTVILPGGESKTVNAKNDNLRFEKVLNAIRENKWDEIPDLICPKKAVSSFSDGHIVVKDGKLFIDGDEVPAALANKIIAFSKQNLPYQILVTFWKNLNMNPSFAAVQGLYAFLENNHHPLTPDGQFIAYKGVDSDFKDLHTHTMDNSPGTVVEMPRNQVDEDQDNACSNGLHVASWDYAHTSYGGGSISGSNVTLMVKVHPRDVVAVPKGNEAKMRVCRYEVLQVINNSITEEVHNDGSMLTGMPFSQVESTYDKPKELEPDDDDDLLDDEEEDI